MLESGTACRATHRRSRYLSRMKYDWKIIDIYYVQLLAYQPADSVPYSNMLLVLSNSIGSLSLAPSTYSLIGKFSADSQIQIRAYHSVVFTTVDHPTKLQVSGLEI